MKNKFSCKLAAYLLTVPLLFLLLTSGAQGDSQVCFEDPNTGTRYLYTYCPAGFLEGKSKDEKVEILENWKAVPTASQKRLTEYYQCQSDWAEQQQQIQQAEDEKRKKQEEYEKAKVALQKDLVNITARLGLSTAVVLTDQVTNAVRAVRAVKESFQQATADIRQARQTAERETFGPHRQREIQATKGFTKAAVPEPPNPKKPQWTAANLDDAAIDALRKFREGKVGQSIAQVDINGKSFGRIDVELSGGGWKPHPTDPTKQISADGQWTKTVQHNTAELADGSTRPWRQIFYENADGGVVRLKPDGMPNAKFDHMRRPHGTKYVKKDPDGDLSFDNEAFKVDGNRAIPKLPSQIEFPPHIKPHTPEAEAYIDELWKTPSHVPLRTSSGGGKSFFEEQPSNPRTWPSQ
jgi:hypothetical protein